MIIVIAIAAIVVIGAVVLLLRSRVESLPAEPGAAEAFRLRPSVAGFHVKGEEALVTFAVPVPAGEVDDVLRDLLIHEAIEVVREKRHELPITQVHRVVVFGKRNGADIEVGRVNLELPGQLPPPVAPELIPHARRTEFDPLAAVSDAPTAIPGTAAPTREGELGPLGSEIRLTAATAAGLRALGIDPGQADAGELGMGILKLAGFSVSPSTGESTYLAARAGKRTLVRVVGAGGYPELGEQEINRFVVDFVSSGADQGLLFSDKFVPFDVYGRERREPRIRFIGRERMQRFADALTMG